MANSQAGTGGNPSDPGCTIAVLWEEDRRGGSRFIHDQVTKGMTLRLREPKNYFRLKQLGRDYTVHYCGRSRSLMAFAGRLIEEHGARAALHVSDEGGRADLASIVAGCTGEDVRIHACGPARLLDALGELCAHLPEGALRSELFVTDASGAAQPGDVAFEIALKDSDQTLTVPAGQTLLEVVRAAGVDVPSDCEEGLCGSCEVRVLEGGVDHRDRVMSASERTEDGRMMACCSPAPGQRLRLAL